MNIEKIQKDDTIEFRGGGSTNVTSVCISADGVILRFGANEEHNYTERGLRGNECGESPLDIVKIISKPFDFKDAKHGMAFKDADGEVVYYLSEHITKTCNDMIVVTRNRHNCSGDLGVVWKRMLTRYPEKDIK